MTENIYEAQEIEIIKLYNAGERNKAHMADLIFDTHNPTNLTRDQLRRRVRTVIDKYGKSLETPEQALNRLKDARPDVYDAYIEECEQANIDPTLVNYFWYKSENFSLNVSQPRKSDKDLQAEFVEQLERIKKNLFLEAESDKWDKIYSIRTQLLNDEKNHLPSGKLFVPNIFDLHIGKLADVDETGGDYNYKIAVERFNNALDDLIQKTKDFRPERIMFPLGNDLFNSDKSKPFAQTTGGTPQQDDIRWQKMFVIGRQLIASAITKLSLIAPVDVVTVFSNHDHERVFYLGEVMDALFQDNPRVTINNSPRVRKYYRWGNCLIGLAHGHNEKMNELPMIMAREAKEMWAECTYFEWLLGHLHHKSSYLTQRTKDYNGVVITHLSSLSEADAWHFEKAFTGSIKCAEAFIYDKKQGLVGSAVHSI